MAVSSIRISQMILHQLADHERRLLSLIVAVRKSLPEHEVIKGDLSAIIQSALNHMVATKVVVVFDGCYSLALAS